jgi:PAS domain S-box-containing protein
MLYNLRLGIFLFLSFSFLSFTSHKKDSSQVSKEKVIYINNIDILVGLADKVYIQNVERSLWYAQTALEIARKQKDKVQEERVLVLISNIYKRTDFCRLSIPFLYKAIAISEELNEKFRMASNYMLLGDVYYSINSSDSASYYYSKSLQYFSLIGNEQGIGEASIGLGNTYWYLSGYDKSLELYLKALVIFEKNKNDKGVAQVNTNIGSLFNLLGDNKNALIYFRKALSNIDKFENSTQISNFYYRYGIAFEDLNQYDSAFFYYKSAKEILDPLYRNRESGYIDQSMSKMYFKRGNVTLAKKLASEALVKFEKINFQYGIALCYNTLIEYYLNDEEYSNALILLDKGLKLSRDIKSVELLKSFYLNYSKYYKQKENFKKALQYHELYQQMNDSVLSKEKTSRIIELQTKYETNKNIQELAAKTEENAKNLDMIKRQRRNLYLFGIGIILILSMSGGLFWQFKLLKSSEKRIKEINKELDNRVKERTAALQLTQFSIEHASDPIFWLDPDGNFLFANLAACNYLDFSKEEFLHNNISNIIPKFTTAEWFDFWEIIKNEGSLVIELFLKKRNLHVFPVEIILNYISHENKQYAFAFIRDISDRKLKEENLRKAKEKAEEADKLKSAFLANMSHEIRTPMNAILGFSDLMLGENLSPEDKREFASIIKSSADTLLKLIDDIIDISLIDAGQLKMNKSTFVLNTVLREIIRFYQEDKVRLQKSHLDIRLNESTFNNLITLNTDPIRFRQIVTNLIGNSIKFTDNGFIEVGFVKTEGKVKIYIKDSGIGIPADKIPLVFQRFHKHNDKGKLYSGTGLGLAISKKMVEQMGGTISAASEVGKGSIFWFTIPYENNQIVDMPLESENNSSSVYNWTNKSILIVEDVESNYYFLDAILKRTGINMFWAKDASEALDYCKNQKPDAVLMDIQLPKMNGYDLTFEILKIYPHMPVIAQTAYAFIKEKEDYSKAGFKEYLTKPIDSNILFETLHKYI